MSQSKPIVAISYAWKEEHGGEHSRKVEAICTRLRSHGIEVLWDREGLSLGGDIREFMQRIGTANFLCVFLSDAYLRSFNCMNELLIAWEASQHRPGEFKERVKVWIMPSAKGILDTNGRYDYVEFWQSECTKLEQLVNRHATRGMHGDDLNKFNRMKQFAEKTSEILGAIAGKLGPQDFAQFENWVCSLTASGMGATEAGVSHEQQGSSAAKDGKMGAEELTPLPPDLDVRLRQVFGAQYERLETILQRRQELRKVLTVRFGLQSVPPEQLTPALILEFHRTFLKALGEFGQVIEDDPAQRDAVLELVSTVLFLSMEPQYADALLRQTNNMEFRVAEDARQGIAEMLLCWTRRKRSVPVAALSREKISSGWESPPQMQLSELKRALISRLEIDESKPDVEERLKDELEKRAHFGRPVVQAIPAENKALLVAVQGDTSLRNLLLLIKDAGNSINSDPQVGANYDRRFEDHLAELLKVAQSPS